jgi:hypothetical protein
MAEFFGSTAMEGMQSLGIRWGEDHVLEAGRELARTVSKAMEDSRLPAPWRVVENPESFVIKDDNGTGLPLL